MLTPHFKGDNWPTKVATKATVCFCAGIAK